ncbi:MAG: integrin alpha, partial [Candidatus Polarisedimenticolia bacterium]
LYVGSPSGLSLEEDWFVRSRLLVGLGTSVAGPGDVDGDGFDDLLVGAPRAGDRDQPAEGFAHLHTGSDSGAARRAFATLEGDQPGANLGRAVCGAGDLNGDGIADYAVGAPAYDNLEQDSGRVFVHLGAPATR